MTDLDKLQLEIVYSVMDQLNNAKKQLENADIEIRNGNHPGEPFGDVIMQIHENISCLLEAFPQIHDKYSNTKPDAH